ncbi:2266_t:CDS:2 [Funneliformis caledonium]|uniref:2266_t:CDS:1 n=1 Tax=Funneliformis caledonium TaxID=1117310 RepID=A0A9N9FN80_9GLOM|nr:2266_t:CDS:2 [Funneliformis caledonium]
MLNLQIDFSDMKNAYLFLSVSAYQKSQLFKYAWNILKSDHILINYFNNFVPFAVWIALEVFKSIPISGKRCSSSRIRFTNIPKYLSISDFRENISEEEKLECVIADELIKQNLIKIFYRSSNSQIENLL